MSDRYLIVADDFTGSNDTGVQLRRRGFPTGVVFAGRAVHPGMSCAVIDTESRALPPETAASAVASALRDIRPEEYKYLIKKVDSTLRGCIAAEVHAMDEALHPELIIFAPALPDLGRTTINGVHMLNGVRITETQLARDPQTPVRQDNVHELMRSAYGDAAVHVDLTALRSGAFDLNAGRVFSFDSETNEDMRLAIAAAEATGKRVLYVGTAAMADNLMQRSGKAAPVFGAVASLSAVTTRQVEAAASAGILVVPVPFHDLLSGADDGEVYVNQCIANLRDGKYTIMASSCTVRPEELELAIQAGAQKGMSLPQVSAYVRRTIGGMAARVLEAVPVSGVFLTGGDTAMGVMDALGADGSEILSEISVGIPMVRLAGGRADGLKAVTKAGAFGAPDAITFAFRKLKEV